MRLRVSGEGPPVVKLPGLAGGVEVYREEMDAAIGAGYRVAALETSGDRRDDPAPGPLTRDLLTAEVFEALDRLHAERAILWGTSFGCLIALAAAEREPRRVSGLLLCVPPYVRMPRLCERAARWALDRPGKALATRVLATLALSLACGWELLAPAALRRLPGLARALWDARTPQVTYHDKARLIVNEPLPRPPANPAIPASILGGAWDLLAPRHGLRLLASRLPGSRVHVLGFSGHFVAWSRPASYNRLVVQELNWLSGRGSVTEASRHAHGEDEVR